MKPSKAPKIENSGKTYYIKEVSAKLGVSTKTLKTWEEKKLVPKARRNNFGWRIYSEAEFAEIEKIVKNNGYFVKKVGK